MTAILTAAEMRALEQAAIARGEVTGLELMERAGRGVVEAILAEWPEIEQGARRAVVLCGPGNNGGDGFVVARLLKERGWEVEVALLGDPSCLPSDAKVNHDRWTALGEVKPYQLATNSHLEWRCDLYVDAVFGIGLSRPIDLELGASLPLPAWDLRFEPGRPRVIAVDVPSGLCSDSGRTFDGDGLWADLTITFHRAKRGHYLAEGPFQCGRVVVADIGLSQPTLQPQPPAVEGLGDRWALISPGPLNHSHEPTGLLEQPPLWLGKDDPFGRPTHKYTHGHAVVLAGGCGKGGAARMAARGALRIGAGLVTLAVPPAALQENAGRLDAIMLRSVRDAGALAEHLQDDRLNALCAGPGLGLGEAHGALVGAVLATGRPTVLDGDALTLVAQDPALRGALHDKVVLTPHEGEFARLFPEIDARWRAPATTGPATSKVDAAQDAAKAAGCVVLLKGPDTVIADPSGRAAINAAVYDRAAPWLATAGSGDTLAGFITGLLARGFAPFDAACTAAWLHVECARSFGPGLIAEDLADELPKVLRALGV